LIPTESTENGDVDIILVEEVVFREERCCCGCGLLSLLDFLLNDDAIEKA
jgi:hypothetical protein